MKRKQFTKEEQHFIVDNHLKKPSREIADHLECSKTKVLRFLKNNKLTVPKSIVNSWRKQANIGRTTFTPEEDQKIRDNYLKIPIKVLGEQMNRSYGAIMKRLEVMGLSIPKEIIEARKQLGRFDKGHIPFSKGRKQSDYMSPESIEKTKATRFKKGNMPHNSYPEDGTIVIRNNRSKPNYPPYKWIRISSANWKMLHVHNWEQEHGALPEGYIVIFKDKNTMNCSLENLEMISKAENMKRNTIHRYPEKLQKGLRLVGKLNKELNKKKDDK